MLSAFLLAAGEGTRLRPLTLDRPKPMIEIAGAPILEHNVRLLASHGVRDIIINTHYHPEAITTHFGDGSKFDVRITYSYEPILLGTAGALVPFAEALSQPFVLIYGDNLSTLDLTSMITLHRASEAELTMALFDRPDAAASGVVEVDEADRIIRFVEKPPPDQIFSRWVNAGFLVVDRSLLGEIPRGRPSDFGYDIFGPLVKAGRRAMGYRMQEELWWIDSVADYERVISEFSDERAVKRLHQATGYNEVRQRLS
jgi:NDP-sugar pyrophosphorylase family protein